MSALSIQVPFPVFQDRDGQPLDNGYVWLGTSSLNPQTNPVVAYYDSALTIVATQPLRTLNGFISRAGSPAQVYVDAVNFSILVQDRQGTTVFSVPEGTGISPNASGVVYDPAGTGAVATTVQAKLRESVSVKDFGAVGDGVADDWLALTTAAVYCRVNHKSLYLPSGTYKITKPWYVTASSVALAQASSNGVAVMNQAQIDGTGGFAPAADLHIYGAGSGATTLLYTGALYHAIQVGSFATNPTYSDINANLDHTYCGSISGIAIQCSNADYGLVLAGAHHWVFRDLKFMASGIASANIFAFSDPNYGVVSGAGGTLWCTFYDINILGGADYGVQFKNIVNSFKFYNLTSSYNKVYELYIQGGRHTFVGTTLQNSASAGASTFVQCEGSTSFYNLECESSGASIQYGFTVNTNQTIVVNHCLFSGVVVRDFRITSAFASTANLMITPSYSMSGSGSQDVTVYGSQPMVANVITPLRYRNKTTAITAGSGGSVGTTVSVVANDTGLSNNQGVLLTAFSIDSPSVGGANSASVYFYRFGYSPSGSYTSFSPYFVAGPTTGNKTYFGADTVMKIMEDLPDDFILSSLSVVAASSAGGTLNLQVFGNVSNGKTTVSPYVAII